MTIHALMRGGLAALAVLVLCTGAFAQSDMLSTLENHEPVKTQAAAPAKSASSVATGTAKAAVSNDVFAKFFERINALFAKLNTLASRVNELMDRLAKAKARNAIPVKAASSSSSASKASSSASASSSGTGESAALNAWKGGKLSPEKFCALLGPVAAASFRATGVPASVTLAQAALETGWGSSTIGSAKNLFGIKGTGPAGSVTVPTKECYNGRWVTINDKFRKYNTWKESIDDHARLISGNARYRSCMKYSNNPDQFAREVQRAGYATDPGYASKLISIMKANNLYKYDK